MAFLGLLIVLAYVGLTAATCAWVGSRAERRRFAARFAMYTLKDNS